MWRDPLVGRDVLIGCAAGICAAIYAGGTQRVLASLGYSPSAPITLPPSVMVLDGPGSFLAILLEEPTRAIAWALMPLFFVFVLRVIFHSQWIAMAVVVAFFGATGAVASYGSTPTVLWLLPFVAETLRVWVLVRFGLFALAVAEFTSGAFLLFPVTWEASAWYASIGFTVIALITGLVIYGFRTALGGRRVFELADV